jgi:hypothetical protein
MLAQTTFPPVSCGKYQAHLSLIVSTSSSPRPPSASPLVFMRSGARGSPYPCRRA